MPESNILLFPVKRMATVWKRKRSTVEKPKTVSQQGYADILISKYSSELNRLKSKQFRRFLDWFSIKINTSIRKICGGGYTLRPHKIAYIIALNDLHAKLLETTFGLSHYNEIVPVDVFLDDVGSCIDTYPYVADAINWMIQAGIEKKVWLL